MSQGLTLSYWGIIVEIAYCTGGQFPVNVIHPWFSNRYVWFVTNFWEGCFFSHIDVLLIFLFKLMMKNFHFHFKFLLIPLPRFWSNCSRCKINACANSRRWMICKTSIAAKIWLPSPTQHNHVSAVDAWFQFVISLSVRTCGSPERFGWEMFW